jgi:phage-related protein
VTNAWTAIKDAIMNALAPLAPAWENLKSNFMDLIRTFVGGKDSNESIWKLMGDHVATFVTWVTQQLIPPLIAGINLFVQVLTFVMNTAAAVIKALASAWDSDFLFIRTIVMDTIDTVKDVISKGLDLIGNVCQAFINLFKGDWAGLWENVKAIVSDAIDLIWDWIQMWGIGKIFKFIGVIAGKYKAAFKELWSGIKNVFDDWLTTIYVKVDDAFKGILDFFNGLKSSFFDAGKNMLQGLADGLGNAVGAVVRKAQEVAQSVLNTVKSIFQIHSPSRVMMDVGFFVGEGLAIGMKNTMGMLQDVSGQVTNAATPFSTYSPTSTPAAATQSESSEINHFNFDRLFEGAVIQVRSDSDIKAIARELYNLTQSKGRGMGVR